MFVPKHVKYIVISLLFFLASVNLVRTTISVMRSSSRLDDLQNEVVSLEEEKSRLEEMISFRESIEFIEEEARNNLNLSKKGEEVFIRPDSNSTYEKKSGEVAGAVYLHSSEGSKSMVKDKSNIQKWIDLFF